MPILEREPDIFPDDLFHGARCSDETEPWWALYTRPRCEKELLRRLRACEIPSYCPLIPRSFRSPAGRKRTSYMPLFRGYVFLRGDDERRGRALTTNCVARCVSVPDPDGLERDLARIWQLIEAGVPLTPEAFLTAGQRVSVRSGPLSGMEGVIVRRQGQRRLIVAVDFLQQGASVLVEDWEVVAV